MRTLLLFCSVFLVCLLLAAYSSGPAATVNAGYTGAPSASGGTEITCSSCHNGGAYGVPTLTARFDGDTLSEYQPGRKYRVTVAVTPAMGTPAGYGFQAQFLDAAADIRKAIGTLDGPDAATQISTTSANRTYAEHSRPNVDSTFSFDWTAPATGAGTATLYATGNAVNRANGSSGDNGTPSPLVIELREAATTATRQIELTKSSLAPNPTGNLTYLSVVLPRSDTYQQSIYASNGTNISSAPVSLNAGPQRLTVDLGNLPVGVYTVRLTGTAFATAARAVKR